MHAVLLPMRAITAQQDDQRVKKSVEGPRGNSNGAPSPVRNLRINRSRYIIQMTFFFVFFCRISFHSHHCDAVVLFSLILFCWIAIPITR
jgi:hypothetical protein